MGRRQRDRPERGGDAERRRARGCRGPGLAPAPPRHHACEGSGHRGSVANWLARLRGPGAKQLGPHAMGQGTGDDLRPEERALRPGERAPWCHCHRPYVVPGRALACLCPSNCLCVGVVFPRRGAGLVRVGAPVLGPGRRDEAHHGAGEPRRHCPPVVPERRSGAPLRRSGLSLPGAQGRGETASNCRPAPSCKAVGIHLLWPGRLALHVCLGGVMVGLFGGAQAMKSLVHPSPVGRRPGLNEADAVIHDARRLRRPGRWWTSPPCGGK